MFILVPLAPTGFNYTREYHEMMSTTLTFEWDPPQGSGPEATVDYYTIVISPLPLSHPCTNVVDVVESRQWNVTLAHNTAYSINISALNCEGRSGVFASPAIEYGKHAFMIFLPLSTCTLYFTVNCGVPVPPMNGRIVLCLHTREGAEVTFQCDNGFRPSNIMNSTCANTGFWIPAPHRLNCTLVTGKLL